MVAVTVAAAVVAVAATAVVVAAADAVATAEDVAAVAEDTAVAEEVAAAAAGAINRPGQTTHDWAGVVLGRQPDRQREAESTRVRQRMLRA